MNPSGVKFALLGEGSSYTVHNSDKLKSLWIAAFGHNIGQAVEISILLTQQDEEDDEPSIRKIRARHTQHP